MHECGKNNGIKFRWKAAETKTHGARFWKLIWFSGDEGYS